VPDHAAADWVARAELEARRFFPHECSHGWDHVLRVRYLAVSLADAEGADHDICEAAALLHDIGRGKPGEPSSGHAAVSAQRAEPILERVGCPDAKAPAILDAIAQHSFHEGATPRELEARILQDADRLDALGAVGIARAFMRAGEQGRALSTAVEHFHEKLLRLRDQMHTPAARAMADRRHRILLRFLEDLADESPNLGGQAAPKVSS